MLPTSYAISILHKFFISMRKSDWALISKVGFVRSRVCLKRTNNREAKQDLFIVLLTQCQFSKLLINTGWGRDISDFKLIWASYWLSQLLSKLQDSPDWETKTINTNTTFTVVSVMEYCKSESTSPFLCLYIPEN